MSQTVFPQVERILKRTIRSAIETPGASLKDVCAVVDDVLDVIEYIVQLTPGDADDNFVQKIRHWQELVCGEDAE